MFTFYRASTVPYFRITIVLDKSISHVPQHFAVDIPYTVSPKSKNNLPALLAAKNKVLHVSGQNRETS